jgi:hypothetical protein
MPGFLTLEKRTTGQLLLPLSSLRSMLTSSWSLTSLLWKVAVLLWGPWWTPSSWTMVVVCGSVA